MSYSRPYMYFILVLIWAYAFAASNSIAQSTLNTEDSGSQQEYDVETQLVIRLLSDPDPHCQRKGLVCARVLQVSGSNIRPFLVAIVNDRTYWANSLNAFIVMADLGLIQAGDFSLLNGLELPYEYAVRVDVTIAYAKLKMGIETDMQISVLRDALLSLDYMNAQFVLALIGELGSEASELIPEIEILTSDLGSEWGLYAHAALFRIGSDPDAHLEYLCHEAVQNNAGHQSQAINALTFCGPQNDIIEAICELLTDQESYPFFISMDSIAGLGPEAIPLASFLVENMRQRTLSRNTQHVFPFLAMGEQILPMMLDLSDDQDPWVAGFANYVLYEYGIDREDRIEAIINLPLSDSNTNLPTISFIESIGSPAVLPLIDKLSDDDRKNDALICLHALRAYIPDNLMEPVYSILLDATSTSLQKRIAVSIMTEHISAISTQVMLTVFKKPDCTVQLEVSRWLSQVQFQGRIDLLTPHAALFYEALAWDRSSWPVEYRQEFEDRINTLVLELETE